MTYCRLWWGVSWNQLRKVPQSFFARIERDGEGKAELAAEHRDGDVDVAIGSQGAGRNGSRTPAKQRPRQSGARISRAA
jgi:hypothetical protein